jgi:hypothetical protein
MSQKQRITQSVDQKAEERQRAIQIQKDEQRQDQEFEVETEELEEIRDDEAVPESDSPEAHEIDALGDSDAFVEPEAGSSPFDLEWVGTLPRVRDLPPRACPRVLYRLSKYLEVLGLTRSKKHHEPLRDTIALAVAEHIRRSGVQLKDGGDWVNIPAIAGNDALINLARENQDELRRATKNRFRQLKSFAVALPNGEVVTVEALVHRGVAGRKATRAAALRVLAAGIVRKELAGEEWTEADWRQLKENEEESWRRRRKRATRREARQHD